MTDEGEIQALIQVRNAINLDQRMWEIDTVESGRVGLVRSLQVDDYVRGEATVELDHDSTGPRFTVRAVVIDSYVAVRWRTTRCGSTADAADSAVGMLRWMFREADSVATRSTERTSLEHDHEQFRAQVSRPGTTGGTDDA